MQNHDDKLDNIGDDASKNAMAAPVFAFPHENLQRGMTLRDWFAGQSLAGLLASRVAVLGLPKSAIVQDAYELADTMLAARKGKP